MTLPSRTMILMFLAFIDRDPSLTTSCRIFCVSARSSLVLDCFSAVSVFLFCSVELRLVLSASVESEAAGSLGVAVGCCPWEKLTSRMAPQIGSRSTFIQFYYESVWL